MDTSNSPNTLKARSRLGIEGKKELVTNTARKRAKIEREAQVLSERYLSPAEVKKKKKAFPITFKLVLEMIHYVKILIE